MNGRYRPSGGKCRPKGWIKEFLKRDARGITGNLDVLFADARTDIFGADKVVHEQNGYWSSWWAGETNGNWLEALVCLAFTLNDKALIEKAEKYVLSALAHQSADGYIGIYKEGHRYKIGARSGEMWTQSRIMRTLLQYAKYTEKPEVMLAVIRMADNIVANMSTELFNIPDEDGSKGHSLMIIDGLYAAYKATGKESYRDFCIKLYDNYCRYPSKFMQDDLRESSVLDPDVPFVGHGAHTCEMLRIPLLLFDMTENERYRRIFEAAVQKMRKSLCISGSCKSDEFIGTYQSEIIAGDGKQAIFGGSVPLPSTKYEYCCTTELCIDWLTAQILTSDHSYADAAEWIVYNAGFASKHPDGKSIQYLGSDNMYDASHVINERLDYSPTHDDAAVCCAPNSCKLVPLYMQYAFLTGDELLANLFFPAEFAVEMNGKHIRITETTDYPFGNTVRFKIHCGTQVAFAIRKPAHTDNFSVMLDGNEVKYTLENGIIRLGRKVRNGETVTLILNPEPRMISAADGTAALAYGPLLFSRNIPAKRNIFRRYANAKGFYDADYTPVPHTDQRFTLLCANGKPQSVDILAKPVQKYPLDEPNVRLTVKALDENAYPQALELVPIGCTTLRRTTFPLYDNAEGIYKI